MITIHSVYEDDGYTYEYAYDGWQILELYCQEGSADLVEARQFVYGNYIDEPLNMDVDNSNGSNWGFGSSDAT